MKRRQPFPPVLFAIPAAIVLVCLFVGLFLGAQQPGVAAASRLATPKPTSREAIAPPAPAGSNTDVSTSTLGSSEPKTEAVVDDGIDYLTHKAEAEEHLKALLTDDHGVRYRDVETRLSTLEGGGIIAFCGWVNSRTPYGGYGGFRRFVASRSVAATEAQMSSADFEQAWQRFCVDGVNGPKVWF